MVKWCSGAMCNFFSTHSNRSSDEICFSHMKKGLGGQRAHNPRGEILVFWCFYNYYYWCFSTPKQGDFRDCLHVKKVVTSSLKSNQHFCALLCFFRKTKSGIERKRQWVWEIGVIHQDKRFVNWLGHFQTKGCNYRNKFTALQVPEIFWRQMTWQKATR